MAIVLDADVIIRGEKGTFDLRGWLAARSADQFEVAAITVAELWHGVERAAGAHKVKREQFLESILSSFLTPSRLHENKRASGQNCKMQVK